MPPGKKPKKVASAPETFTVPMSQSERTTQRTAGMSCASAGSVFNASGALMGTAPEVIAGFIQRAQRDAAATNKATATTTPRRQSRRRTPRPCWT